MEGCLKRQIQAAVDIDNVRNAIFLAERLHERRPTDENAILLAQCYARNRQDYRAVGVLQKRNALSARGRLLLAQALWRTNDLERAEVCIDEALKTDFEDKDVRAEFHYLSGLIICETKKLEDEARRQFARALECNAFHWASIEQLCKLGRNEEMKNYIRQVERQTEEPQQQEMEVSEPNPEQMQQSQNVEGDGNEMVVDSAEGQLVPCPTPGIFYRREPSPVTPQSLVRPVFHPAAHTNATNSGGGIGPVTRQAVRMRDNAANRRRSNDPLNPETPAGKIQRVDAPAGSIEGKTEWEPSSDSVYYSAEDNLSEACPVDRRTPSVVMEADNPNPWPNNGDGETQLRSLFRYMSHALYAVNTCDHDSAHQLLMNLTNSPHGESAWIKCKLGCLYMQSVKYETAKQMFLAARALDQTHLEDMDKFSSLLYMMDDTGRLGNLVTVMREMDSSAPETWCVAGNYYSLKKDHQRALDAFQRAIQLDDGYAYAYALCGQTYLDMQRTDKASAFFTEAIQRGRYHPSGWFGRGVVLSDRGEFKLASRDFKRAVDINPHHAVFRLRYAMTLAQLVKAQPTPERYLKAIEEFDMATKLDNRNKDAFLNKGKLQYALKSYQEARETFEKAARRAHKDAEVHYYLGLACKRLGDTMTASSALSKALDLDPNSILRSNIRAALDRVNCSDDDELRKY